MALLMENNFHLIQDIVRCQILIRRGRKYFGMAFGVDAGVAWRNGVDIVPGMQQDRSRSHGGDLYKKYIQTYLPQVAVYLSS